MVMRMLHVFCLSQQTMEELLALRLMAWKLVMFSSYVTCYFGLFGNLHVWFHWGITPCNIWNFYGFLDISVYGLSSLWKTIGVCYAYRCFLAQRLLFHYG
jgi:1-acyl-sn-glycerol-3-phosphate acyltransferase